MVQVIHLQQESIREIRRKVIRELRQKELYKPNLIFRGFSRNVIPTVLEYGTENPNSEFIYGNPEGYLGNRAIPRGDPLRYALHAGALAVYDGDLLHKWWYTCYSFDADKRRTLVAVFLLE